MKAKNKWNGNVYEILSEENGKVTMKRPDSSVFTISKSEFYFTYIQLTK